MKSRLVYVYILTLSILSHLLFRFFGFGLLSTSDLEFSSSIARLEEGRGVGVFTGFAFGVGVSCSSSEIESMADMTF